MHTKIYSPDASQSPEELITTAKSLGIKNVTITEHNDMDFPDKEFIWEFDLQEYSRSIKEWQEFSRSIDGPSVHMGIEIGWQSHLKDRIEQTATALPFDSLLLSIHVFHGVDIYYGGDIALMPRKERNKEYISALARMCREIDNYDIVAHYDYINRYIEDKSSSVFYKDCPEEFDDLFDALISKDKALEINTASIEKQIVKGSSYIMPDPDVIRRYISMGGKLITIGSDAHTTERIGLHFDRTAKYLKSLGVSEIFYYEGRTPISDPEYSKYF